MNQDRREAILVGSLPHRILLGRDKRANHYRGYVEHSFSMGLHEERTYLYWSGKAVSNFGSTHQLDALSHAERDLAELTKRYPEMVWEMFDPHEEAALPVVMDWEDYLDGNEISDKSLSGVKDKFRARNIRFKMKEEP